MRRQVAGPDHGAAFAQAEIEGTVDTISPVAVVQLAGEEGVHAAVAHEAVAEDPRRRVPATVVRLAGSSIEVDDAIGWGFTIGYNLTANWNFSYKFTMASPDYTATIVPEPPEGEDPVPRVIDYQLDKYSHALNATWNWFDGPLTPFLQGGIGWTRIDSNIPSQPPQTGCWWDPWWGYICDTTWKTYETSDFAYNLGIGLRWDINGALFLRGSYNREWISVDSGDLDFDTLSLDMGLMW